MVRAQQQSPQPQQHGSPNAPGAAGVQGRRRSTAVVAVFAVLLLVCASGVVGAGRLTQPATPPVPRKLAKPPQRARFTDAPLAPHIIRHRKDVLGGDDDDDGTPATTAAAAVVAVETQVAAAESGHAAPTSWKSTAPLGNASVGHLVAGEAAASMKQIHHGIYKVVGATSNVRFALKTECRPAAKWHGQQGWTEVAVHHFARLVFGRDANTVPPAVGAVVSVTAEQRGKIVHKDGCGADPGPVTSDAPMRQAAIELAATSGGPGKDAEPLIGVALEWRPTHSDEALDKVIKPRDLGRFFRPATLKAHRDAGGVPRKDVQDAELVRQVSDITVLDYLVANEDREEKNWFTVPVDASTASSSVSRAGSPAERATAAKLPYRFVAMDNGWAFIGRGYRTSMCSADEENLRCPPLLRYLSGSGSCAQRGSGKQRAAAVTMEFCRFRRATIDNVSRVFAGKPFAKLSSSSASGDTDDHHHHQEGAADASQLMTAAPASPWASSARAEWQGLVRQDPLVAWLLEQYGRKVRVKAPGGHGVPVGRRGDMDADAPAYSEALARYVHGCPRPASVAADAEWHGAAGLLGSVDTTADVAAEALIEWLGRGVEERAMRLLQHVQGCVARYGDRAVFGDAASATSS